MIKQAFFKSIPVLAGDVVLGIGFGMLVIYCLKEGVSANGVSDMWRDQCLWCALRMPALRKYHAAGRREGLVIK